MSDIFPKKSIFPETPPPAYAEEDAQQLASMYSLAQGNTDTRVLQSNTFRVLNGDGQRIKEEIAINRNSQIPDIRSSLFKDALSRGDVEGATSALYFNQTESPDVAVGNAVAENTTATKMNDDNEYTDDFAQDAETNARLVILNNAIVEFLKRQDEKYAATPEESARMALTPGAEIIPKGSWKMIGDFLATWVNSLYTYRKAHKDSLGTVAGEMIFPGFNSKAVTDRLYDPNISTEEFSLIVQSELSRFKEEYRNNPMAGFSAMLEAIYTDVYGREGRQVTDKAGTRTELQTVVTPMFERLRTIKNFVDEHGEVQPNLLPEMVNPESNFEIAMYDPAIQSLLQSPAWDFSMLKVGGAFNLARSILGKENAAKAIASNMLTENIGIQEHLAMTQLAHPNRIISPDVLYDVQKNQDIINAGLNEMVDPQRVQPTAAQYAVRSYELANELFPVLQANPNAGTALSQNVAPSLYLNRNNLAWIMPEADGGNTFYNIRIQSPSGKPFKDDKSAVRYADNLRLTDYTIENNGPNQYFIQIKYADPDAAYLSNQVPQELFTKNKWDTLWGVYTRPAKYIYTPNVTVDNRIRGKASSAALEVAALTRTYNKLNSSLRILSDVQKDAVADILLAQMREPNPRPGFAEARGKWYSEQEIDQWYLSAHGRQATKEEKTAIYAYKQSNDLGHTLINKRIRDEVAAGGYNHWIVDDVPGIDHPVIAKLSEQRSSLPQEAAVLMPDGVTVSDGANVARTALNDPDNILVKMYGNFSLNGKRVSHMLLPRNRARTTGLAQNILNYVEGGTREYVWPHFTKIARKGNTAFTVANHKTPKAAAKFAQEMNAIRHVFNNYTKATSRTGVNAQQKATLAFQADRDIQRINPHWSLQKFTDRVDAGDFDPTEEFITRYNRQAMPSEGMITEGEMQLNQLKGKLYYSSKGEHLVDENGDLADLISPFAAIARQQAHAARVAGFDNFALSEMHRWAQAYKKYLSIDNKVGKSLENYFRYGKFEGEFGKDFPKYVQNQAEAERMYIRRILRHTDSDFNRKVQNARMYAAINLANMFGDKKWLPDKYFHALKTGEIATEGDALNVLKGLSYDYHLGALRIDQFWVQGSAAFPIVLMEPKLASLALRDYFYIRAAAIFDYNNKLVDVLAKKQMKWLGYSKDEFVDLLNEYNRTAAHSVGATDAVLDAQSNVAPVVGTLSELRESSRFFLYEGDRVGRIVGFGVARRKALDLVAEGRFKKGSPEYIEYIRGELNRLQMTMMSGGESFWNRNMFTSLMTQMWQFSVKMMEVNLGLNRSLTRSEKSRLMVGQIAAYGGMGYIFGPQIIDAGGKAYRKLTGEQVDQEKLEALMYGPIDQIASAVFNEDTAFGARLGNGDFLPMLYDQFKEKNVVALFAGMSGDDVAKNAEALGNLSLIWATAYGRAQEGQLNPAFVTSDVLTALGRVLASMSTYTKAYYVDKYDLVLNSRGDTIMEENTKRSALMTAMGVYSPDELLNYKAGDIDKAREESAKEIGNQLAQMRIEAAIAFKNNNIPLWKHHIARQAALMGPLNDDPELQEKIDRWADAKMRSGENKAWLEEHQVYWKKTEE